MTIWMVFVKARWNGAMVARYIDSHWAVQKSASKRARELDDSFRGFGCYSAGNDSNGLTTFLVEGELADCALSPAEPKTE